MEVVTAPGKQQVVWKAMLDLHQRSNPVTNDE